MCPTRAVFSSIHEIDRKRGKEFYWLSWNREGNVPPRCENVSRSPFPPLSHRGESMIAFMGEERVLRDGDNVPVAATEASLSEIKHDEPPRRPGGKEGHGGNFTLPWRFSSSSPPPINFAAFHGKTTEGGAKRTLVFTRAILVSR